MRRKRKYFIKRNKGYISSLGLNNIYVILKNMIIGITIFIMFIVSLNIAIKYILKKYNFSFNLSLPIKKPKYFILQNNNFYILYSNGDLKFVDKNIDGLSLPILNGINIKKYNKHRINQILKIKQKYLKDISEINLKNKKNIILITLSGKKIFVGETITNEKMKNYLIAIKKFKENKIKKKYKVIDLRYKNRVIIK